MSNMSKIDHSPGRVACTSLLPFEPSDFAFIKCPSATHLDQSGAPTQTSPQWNPAVASPLSVSPRLAAPLLLLFFSKLSVGALQKQNPRV